MKIVIAEKTSPAAIALFREEPSWTVVTADHTNAGTDKPILAVRGQNVYVGFDHTQTVYVAGSNLKRTATEGTAPVSVMTAQDIKNTGATTVSELMKFVPAISSGSNDCHF